MSSAINIPFAHSLVISSSSSSSSSSVYKITLLDGAASVNGVSLQLHGPGVLFQTQAAAELCVIVDCTNISGCRIDISPSSNNNHNSSNIFRKFSTKIVPHASSLLDGLIRRVRESRTMAKNGQGEPPRILVFNSSSASSSEISDRGLSKWACHSLIQNPAAYPNYSYSSTTNNNNTEGSSSSSSSAASSSLLDLSLDESKTVFPLLTTTTTTATNSSSTQMKGSCTLNFYSSSTSTSTTTAMDLMETYSFFLGIKNNDDDDDHDDQALMDVATTCVEMYSYVAGNSLQHASSGLVINFGNIDFANNHSSFNAFASLLPKVVRQLRITHVAAIFSSGCHDAGENQKLADVVRSAADSMVRGVSVEFIRVPFFEHHSNNISSFVSSSSSSSSTLSSILLNQYFRNGKRIVVELSNLDLRDVKTLKKIRHGDNNNNSNNGDADLSTTLKLFSLCGVCAPSSQSHQENPILRKKSQRLVVGYVVVVEIGPSCVVLLTPNHANGLPSKTLLVSSQILVSPDCLPSIVESY